MKSLQETYAPSSTCFGCSLQMKKGLKSGVVEGDKVVAV